MNPYSVVRDFETALSEYTGAPYVITVDSCSNALFLVFKYKGGDVLTLPKKTYVGVLQAALNADYAVRWSDEEWLGNYVIPEVDIIDSARHFSSGMFKGVTTCVSFQASKILPIGRGGAILTDDIDLASWCSKARLDGRTPGSDVMTEKIQFPGYHCYMTPPDAARGLWLLSVLPKVNPPQCGFEMYRDLSLVYDGGT